GVGVEVPREGRIARPGHHEALMGRRLGRSRGSLRAPDQHGEGEQTNGCSEGRESEGAGASHMKLSFLAAQGDRVVSTHCWRKFPGTFTTVLTAKSRHFSRGIGTIPKLDFRNVPETA